MTGVLTTLPRDYLSLKLGERKPMAPVEHSMFKSDR